MEHDPKPCVAELADGRRCANDSNYEPAYGVHLCCRHYQRVVDFVHTDDRRRHAEWRHADDKLGKLEQVKPTYRRLPTGWHFRMRLPSFDFGPSREVRRQGFPTKRAAETEAAAFLESLKKPLRQGVEQYRAAITERQEAAARAVAAEKVEQQRRRATELGSAKAARRERERTRFVYYVRRPDGSIKIGTTVNVERRMQALRNVSPVQLLASHGGGQLAEAALHRRFARLRRDGEWFTPAPELIAHVDRVVAVRNLRNGSPR